ESREEGGHVFGSASDEAVGEPGPRGEGLASGAKVVEAAGDAVDRVEAPGAQAVGGIGGVVVESGDGLEDAAEGGVPGDVADAFAVDVDGAVVLQGGQV